MASCTVWKAAVVSVDDLPEGVLPADLAVGELKEVAPADLDALPRRLGAADRPLRYAAVTAGPMAIIAVVNIGDPIEPGLDARPNLLFADETTPAWGGSAWHVQDAVLGEERHHRVDVVGVERVKKRLQRRRHHLRAGHGFVSSSREPSLSQRPEARNLRRRRLGDQATVAWCVVRQKHDDVMETSVRARATSSCCSTIRAGSGLPSRTRHS